MSIQNILFDFYGTLAGIHTDESRKELWRCLSVWYQSHGAAYTPLQLRRDYRQSVQEEKRLASARHPQYTALDIRIESVFERLYAGRDVHASSDVIAETALFSARCPVPISGSIRACAPCLQGCTKKAGAAIC